MVTTYSKQIRDAKRGFPLTRYPQVIPKVQDKIATWQIAPNSNNRVGFSQGAENKQYAHGDCLTAVQEYLRSSDLKVLVPQNTLTVSIAMHNFRVGKSCQEFQAVDQKSSRSEDTYFTYRMLSKHVQATYYHVEATDYLAGVCYYLQDHRRRFVISTKLDVAVMELAMRTAEAYPPSNIIDTRRFQEHRSYARYCSQARKRVEVNASSMSKSAGHVIVHLRKGTTECSDCFECNFDLLKQYELKRQQERRQAASAKQHEILEAKRKEEEEESEHPDMDFMKDVDETKEENINIDFDVE